MLSLLFAGSSIFSEENEIYAGEYEESVCSLCRETYSQSEEVKCASKCREDEYCSDECNVSGWWLPEDPVLFHPLIADPRQIIYSAGWRFNDEVLAQNVIDVSFGDSLAVYRWNNIWPWNGKLQLEIEGALWATFAPLHESAPLINADYYVGFPITYAINNWEFRLRGYHISSHIGDEFLLNHPGFDRRNPSAEYIDFFVSHQFTQDIRLYSGLGWVVFHDESFFESPFYAEAGLELRLRELMFNDQHDLLYGIPFYAMNFRYNGKFKKHIDATYVLGYELGKLCGLRRKVRIYLEYHDGYSVEGQFSRYATRYLSLRASYGF